MDWKEIRSQIEPKKRPVVLRIAKTSHRWIVVLLIVGVPAIFIFGVVLMLFSFIIGSRYSGLDVAMTEGATKSGIKKTEDGHDGSGLVLLRRGLRIETGPNDARIVGVIENRKYSTSFNAWVLFDLYDENGKKIGEAGTERNNDFPGWHSWNFQAMCPRNTAKIKLAKLGGHWYSN